MADPWDNGGGFINDSVNEDPQQVTSSVSLGGDDKNKLVAACSVAQITKLTRPTEGLIIHGKKIYLVNLVAYVHEIVDINQTKIHILVDDHTGGGPLEVNHVIGDTGSPGDDPSLSMFNGQAVDSNPDQPRSIHSIQIGDYVRVVGVVKYSQDRANINAYNLRILEDPNDISRHIITVIRDSLYFEKLQASGGVLPVSVRENIRPVAQNNNNQATNMGSNLGQLSTQDKHLLNFLRAKAKGDGMHIDDIVKSFTAFGRNEILQSLQALSQEGLCWTSDDENIWCADE